MDQRYPKLRLVDAIPVTIQGKQLLLLKDPLKLCSSDACVPMEAVQILRFFDGRHSVSDIAVEVNRSTGIALPVEELEQFVATLDRLLLLESEAFHQALDRMRIEFHRNPDLPAPNAGVSYPSDASELKDLLDSFYTHEHGPGTWTPTRPGPVRALIAPHIDIKSGGPTFAWSYQALRDGGRLPDLFVILGTGHRGLENLFACTKKNFVTPFGPVTTDRDFVDALADGMEVDLLGEELAHRSEHVIEFQLVFLQHLLGGRHDFSVVPMLCSFEADLFTSPDTMGRARVFDQVTTRLRDLIRRSDKQVCLIASVDLDHVGPRYGDQFRPGAQDLARHLEEDRALLEMASQGRAEEFAAGVSRENHRKKICGFSPIYTLMKALPEARGELLRLDHSIVDNQGSFVSYAAMSFYDP